MNNPRLRLFTTYRGMSAPIAYLDYSMDRGSHMVQIDNQNLEQNTPEYYDYESLPSYGGTPVIHDLTVIPSGHYLISNKYIDATDTWPGSPAFWAHELKYDLYDDGPDPRAGINVYREDGKLMDPDSYRIEHMSGTLVGARTGYHRYTQNTFKPWGTGWCPEWYGSGSVHRTRLCFPDEYRFDQHWYRVAYNKYIDSEVKNHSEYVNPKPALREGVDYFIQAGSIGWMEGTGTLTYVKKAAESTIRILPPYEQDITQGWHPRVSDGSIVLPASGSNTLYSTHWETRYNEPSMYTGFGGYMVVKGHTKKVAEREYQVDQPPIWLEPSGRAPGYSAYYLESPRYIPTLMNDGYAPGGTGSVGMNVYVDDKIISQADIEDVQEKHGLVRLKEDPGMRNVTVSYVHKTDSTTIRTLDMNPTYNHPGMDTKNAEVAIYLDRAASNGSGTLQWEYLTGTGYHATEWRKTTATAGRLLIGRLSIKAISHQAVAITDIRRKGGGIVASYEHAGKETHHYGDISRWDGDFLPGAYGLVVQLPTRILTNLRDEYIEQGYEEKDAYDEAISYVRSVIEQNMSAGSNYVLVDETKTPWTINV